MALQELADGDAQHPEGVTAASATSLQKETPVPAVAMHRGFFNKPRLDKQPPVLPAGNHVAGPVSQVAHTSCFKEPSCEMHADNAYENICCVISMGKQ